MAKDPYKYFRPEARDLIDQAAKGVLVLESGGEGTAAVQHLLRVVHTLKGAARVVRQAEIADSAHAIEDVLMPHRDGAQGVEREQVDAILAHLDAISGRLVALNPPAAEGEAPHAGSRPDNVSRMVRTDVADADLVLESITQAHALLAGLRKTTHSVEQTRRLSDLAFTQLAGTGSGEPRRSPAGNSRQRANIAEEFRRRLAGVERDLGTAVDQLDRELRQLREAAERLRLVSPDGLLTALERIARDTANTQSKEVVFEGRSGDTRLDLHLLETIQSALIQLVRNSVAHGIEPSHERIAAGKPAAGRIRLAILRRGRNIVFECSDDGRGIDLEAVRHVAEQRGMLTPSGKSPEAAELVGLLLRGGITTTKTVTGVSGRGVGLDVVCEAISRLGGEVSVSTRSGVGTTFSLIVPPSLASMEALMVESDGPTGTVVLPFERVRSTLRVTPTDQIADGPGRTSILIEDKAIPFVSLASVLGGNQTMAARNWTAVVVAGAQGLAAFGVDRLAGTGNIVVRPLPEAMLANPMLAGASLDAEGHPRLVLDADGLVDAACRGGHARQEPVVARRPILVVDDSMTTRMLEKSILESAGHNVEVALSGEEALERVRGTRYGLILVDVEMPGMDGFTFIEHIRSDAAVRDVPAILVSSRNAPEDLRRGHDAGAQGYIVKSEFDQAEFLSMIDRLVS